MLRLLLAAVFSLSAIGLSQAQTPVPTVLNANSFGGASVSTILSAGTNNSTSLKAAAGTLLSVTWGQTTASLMDIRFYDTAAAPTCSSATGMKINLVVPANTTTPVVFSSNFGPAGVAFVNGIGICITGANANNDNTNAVTGLNVVTTFQ